MLKVPTYEICFKRPCGRTADDFTEKDLIIIFPGVPHCYTRDEAYADIDCEAVAVQFSRDMPNWQLLETEYLQPIQKMLSLPVAGLHFSEKVVDRVRDRLLQLPGLRGFESVVLFLDILNDLATAGPDEMHIIGTTDYKTQADGNERIKKILQFVENNYHNKITLEDIGAEVGMSPSSVFQEEHLPESLDLYQRVPHRARRADDRGDRRSDFGNQHPVRIPQHLEFQPRLPRAHRLGAGRIPAQIRLDGDFARPAAGRGDRPQTRRFTQRSQFVRGGGKSVLRNLFGKRREVV